MSDRKRNYSHESRENYTSCGKRRRSESRLRPFFFNHDHDFKHYFSDDKLKTGKQFFEIFYGWNSPFSQNYVTPFSVDDMTFNCAQQYYMYRKAVLFENKEIQRLILETTDQNEMKKLGKEIPNFDRREWMKHAVDIVQTASRAKFTQNKKLREQLFATYPKILVEANPFDNIWGIGVGKHESAAWDMRAWPGENLLGFILTELRDELMQLEETGEALMEGVRESNASSIREQSQIRANEGNVGMNESQGSFKENFTNVNESEETVNGGQVNLNESRGSVNESQGSVSESQGSLNESQGSMKESHENMNEGQVSLIEGQESVNESQKRLVKDIAEMSYEGDSKEITERVLTDQGESAMDKNNVDNKESKSDNVDRNVTETDVKENTNSENKEINEKESTRQRNTESYLSKMKRCRSAKDGSKDKIDYEQGESDWQMDLDVKEEGEIENDESCDERTNACWEEEWKTEDIVEEKQDKGRESRSRRRHSESRWGKEENWDKDVEIDKRNSSWEMKKPESLWRDRSSPGVRFGVEDLREKVNRRRSESVLPRMTPSSSKHNHVYKSYFEPENMIHDPDKLELFFGWYSPFSQHHPATFEIKGKTFSCAEQWYMYNKAVLFHDKEVENKIMATTDPKEMKMLGRKVKNFDRKIWMENAIDIVKRGNLAKFSQNPRLKEKLFETYPRVLVEASPMDSVWGVGLHKSNPAAWDMRFWRGENLLGFTLTQVRDQLMSKKSFPGGSKDRGRSLVRRTDFPDDLSSRRDKLRSESLPSRLAQPEIRNHEHVYKSYFESQNMVCGYKNFVFFFGKEFPFSNHHSAEFVLEGKTFTSSEQYYMYQKAVMFKDKEIGRKIMNSRDPKEQKRFGKLVRNFDYRKWLTKAVDVTKTGLMAKFSQNPNLKTQLLETHPRVLVEASPGDKIWGIGLGRDDPKAWDMRTWRGENLLGFTLMSVREELRRREEERKKGERRRSEKFRRDKVYSMHRDDSDEENDEDEERKVCQRSRAERRRTHHDSPTSELERKYLRKKYSKTTWRNKYYSDSDSETKYNRSSTSRKKHGEKDKHKKYDSSSDTESICSMGRKRSEKRNGKVELKTKDREVPKSSTKYDSEREESPDGQKSKKFSREKQKKRSQDDKSHRSCQSYDRSSSSREDLVDSIKKPNGTHSRNTSRSSKYESIISSDDSSIERLRKTSVTSECDSDKVRKGRGNTSRSSRRDASNESSEECKRKGKRTKMKSRSKNAKEKKKSRKKDKTETDSSSDSSDNSKQRKKQKHTMKQEIHHRDKRDCDKEEGKEVLSNESLKIQSKTSSKNDQNDDKEDEKEQMYGNKTTSKNRETKKSNKISEPVKEQNQTEELAEDVDGGEVCKPVATGVNEDGNFTEEGNAKRRNRKRKVRHSSDAECLDRDHGRSPEKSKLPLEESREIKRKKVYEQTESFQDKRSKSEEEDDDESGKFRHVPHEETKEQMDIKSTDPGKISIVNEIEKEDDCYTDRNKIDDISVGSAKLSKTSEDRLSKTSTSFKETEQKSSVPDQTCKQKHEYVTIGKCDVEDMKIIKEKETFKKKEKEFKAKINKRNYRRSDGHETSETIKLSEKEDSHSDKAERQHSEKAGQENLKLTHKPRGESSERSEREKFRKQEFEKRKYSRRDSTEEKERHVLKSSKSGQVECKEKRRYSDSRERRSSERKESTSFQERRSVETSQRKGNWSSHDENRSINKFEREDTRLSQIKFRERKEKSIRLSSSVFESHDDEEVFVGETKKGQGHKRKFSSVEPADSIIERQLHKKKKKKKGDYDEMKNYDEKKTKKKKKDDGNKDFEKKKEYDKTRTKAEYQKESSNRNDYSSNMKGHKEEIFKEESEKEDKNRFKKVSSKKDKKKKKKDCKKKCHDESGQYIEDLNCNLEKKKKKKKKEKKAKRGNEEKSEEEDDEAKKMDSTVATTKVVNLAAKKNESKSNESDSSREEKKICIKINSNIRLTKTGSGEETDWSANCNFDVTCNSTK